MRLSMGSINVLASNWPLFMARAGGALMLALAIAVTDNLYTSGFAGMLGLYAVTEGVLAGITWLRDRRFRLFSIEAATGITFGLVMLLWSHSATLLLVLFAMRGLAVAGIQAAQTRASLLKRDAKIPLILAALCAAVSLGFLVVAAFGYDALDLYACIAGYQALYSGGLAAYGLRLWRGQTPPPRSSNNYDAPSHHARPLR